MQDQHEAATVLLIFMTPRNDIRPVVQKLFCGREGKLTIARRPCRTGVSMCSRTVTMATLKSSADTELPPAPASSPKAERREEKKGGNFRRWIVQ